MANVSIMEANYNLTKVFNEDIVNDPVSWISSIQNALGGFLVPGILITFGILLFLAIRNYSDVTDAEAGAYAGYITSFIGVFLFLTTLTTDPGSKIITWGQLSPIIVITGVMIILSKITKNY